MNTMNLLFHTKRLLLTNWHYMRWLRLGLGIFFGFQAIAYSDAFAGFISIFFLFQSITNTGCCGPNGCSVAPSDQIGKPVQDVEFEEIRADVK